MYQDSKGRLYFLTYGGLSVYDGARFTNYGPAEGLTVDMVNDVLEVAPDSLLVATNSNQLVSLVKGKIKPLKTADGFCPVINSFFKSRNGSIYIASDEGLFVWQDQTFRHLPFLYNGKEAGQFMWQIQEVANFLLILIHPGISDDAGALFLYDPMQQRILSAEKKIITSGITASAIGDIWLCSNKGLRVLKKETLQEGKIIAEEVPQTFSSVQNKKASFIKFNGLGQLWLSIYNEGLLFVKPGTAPVLYNETSGLGSTLINFIFGDKEGNNWFIPDGKGVQKLVSNNIEFADHPFRKNFITDLYALPRSDSVWFYDGTKGELILIHDQIKKTFTPAIPHMNRGHLLANGSLIWLYDEKKIYRISFPSAGNAVDATLLYNDSSQQTAYGIIDPNGNLIYCANSFLKVFLKNKTTFSYQLDYYADEPSIDQTGHLWIATRSNKLQVFTLHPEDPVHYLQLQSDLSNQEQLQNPRSMTVDNNERIWVGTRFNGLYCFSFSQNHLTLLQHLTRKEGLSDNFINYLSCDSDNNIWASTPAGLDKLETTTLQPIIKNITQGNHLFLSFKKVMTDGNGTTWALGVSGNLLKVSAEPKINAAFTPLFYIARIKSGSALFTDVDAIHSFSYLQNNLNFSVAAPSFYNERQIRYSYFLDGICNNLWSEPSGDADFNFVNLAPGKYTLKVKADFPEARYPSQLLSYSFIIDPPWWQTLWFRLLAAIITILLIIYFIRFYYQRKLEKQRVILEKKQAVEKERTRIATDIHDDLGAGLSKIKFLSETIGIKKQQHQSIDEDISKIRVYAHEMIDNMGEIVWALNEKNDSLSDLLSYTRAYTMEYLSQNGIACKVETIEPFAETPVNGEFRRNIYLTVKEALHNVVKHAQATTVHITIKTGGALTMGIQDNGIGFDQKHIRPFSNGLTNMEMRIKEIGGKISIRNNSGTMVKFTVPLPA